MKPGHRTGPQTGHLTGPPTGVPIVPPTGLLPQHGLLQGNLTAGLRGFLLLIGNQDQIYPDLAVPVVVAAEEAGVAVASGEAEAEDDNSMRILIYGLSISEALMSLTQTYLPFRFSKRLI